MAPVTNDQTLEPGLLCHQSRGRHFVPKAGEHANERDVSANPHRSDRLRERTWPADLNHMIYATPAAPVARASAPVIVLPVVDRKIGAHRAYPLQLLVGRRGGDDRCAHHLRDLQGENRDAAGAECQHDIARL
jgi:hypothetical protein